ncbi:MAG: TolC family protein [Litorimonas sp.]
METAATTLASLTPPEWQSETTQVVPGIPSWQALDDPVLQDLIAQGLNGNLSIEAALLRLESGLIGLEQAETALRPRLSLGRGSASVTQSRTGDPFDSYSFGGGAQYQVDLWGRIRNNVTQSDLSVEQQQIQNKALRISTAQAIANVYIDLRVRDEVIRLQEHQIEIQGEQLRLSEVRLQAGAITRLSVDQIRVSIQRLLGTLEASRATRADLERRLALLLGLPPHEFTLEPRPFQTFDLPRIMPHAPADVLIRRPDIRSAECGIVRAGLSLDTARKAWLPNLSVSGSTTQSSLSLFDLVTTDGISASIGAAMSVLLYDNGDRTRAIAQAEIAERQTIIGYQQTVLAALEDIERILTRQSQNMRQIEIQRLQEEAQQRVTRITQAQYDTGAASAFDLIREQSNGLNARQSRVLDWSEGVKVHIAALGALAVDPMLQVGSPKSTDVGSLCQ